MRQIAMSVISVVLAMSVAMAEDDAAVKSMVAERTAVSGVAEDQTPGTAPLDALEWMVGEWIDEGEGATIITTCSWTKKRKFLKRSFKVTIDEKVTLEGDQFVGWDPLAGQIRSWTFDSEGGFGEGLWIQDGNRWLVKASFVLADGSRASALNVYTLVDDDTIRWQSTNREIAGELQPNIPEVTVIRQKDEATESPQNEKEESQ